MIELFRLAWNLIRQNNVPLWLYALLALTCLVSSGISADYFDDDTSWWFLLPLLFGLTLSIWLQWRFTRLLGDALHTPGSVLAWIGWALPLLPIYGICFAVTSSFETDSWLLYWLVESFGFALSLAIAAPFLIVATGRALDFMGPSASAIINASIPIYARLALTSLIVYFPTVFLDEVFRSNFGDQADNGLEAFAVAALGGPFYFIQIVVMIAIYISAYRKIEAVLADNPTGR